MKILVLLIFLASCSSAIPPCEEDRRLIPCQTEYEVHYYTYDELIRYEEFDAWVDDWRYE